MSTARGDAARRCCGAAGAGCWAQRPEPARPGGGSRAGQPKAKAKAVIQIWMWGGASHLDTFDPKPEAGNDYCGPLNKPIATNVDGIRIGELLPLLAKQADKYSIIRSMTHGSQRPRDGGLHGADRPGARRAGCLPRRRRGGLAVQGLRRRLQGADSALHRADRAAGAVLRGGVPRGALQAVRHGRRPGAEPVRGGRRRGAGHLRPAAAGPARVAAQAQHARSTPCRAIRNWRPRSSARSRPTT